MREGRNKRFTLRKHPDEYKRQVKCPSCGSSVDVRSDEKNRQNELQKETRCYCSSYPFPHRSGSLRFCANHPLADVDGTEEEIADYEAIWETKRGGA